MKISARNQFTGKIESIQEGSVNAMVALKLASGVKITGTISMAAVADLGLAAGKEATAIIKATEVMIAVGDVKISARNQLAGEITAVTEGAVNASVTLQTTAGDITATISLSAVKELGLAVGSKAAAIVKSTSVIFAV